MESIWITLAEISVEPGDLPSGATRAFAKITTWADSSKTVEEKLSRYLETYKWRLLSMQDAQPIDEEHDYGDEIQHMIERTRENPKAIILGRFFSYKVN